MSPAEYARAAWQEIKAHKTRSAMTCLSLAVGVAALLFTFSQTGGTMKRYRDELKLAGPGRLTVEHKQNHASRGISQGLTAGDADAIRAEFPELFMVYPLVRRWSPKFRLDGFKNDSMQLVATTDEWRRRDWVYRPRGRFLTSDDVRARRRVCVLIQSGRWIHKPWWGKFWPEQPLMKYLEHHDALGRRAVIEGHLFTVVGILQEPPKDLDPRWIHHGGGDGVVVVPITAFEDYLHQSGRRPDAVDEIEVDTADAGTASIYLRRVHGLLASRHREDDFEVKDFRQLLQGALAEIRKFIASIMVIGIVAVLASGIGIMNVTLATIFSRVREIGVRRALGARRSDIVWQFVAEAMALGLVGGAAGTALGAVGVVALAPREERFAAIGPLYISAALLIALATGFLFALYPAYKASRFDPVEALRYE